MRKQIAFFCAALLLDQALKYFFGLGSKVTTSYFLLTVLIFGYFFIIIIIYYLNKNFRDQSVWALIFLLAGVTSNLADRVVLGYVRDYINIGSLVFNLADVMIIGGIVYFVVFLIKTKNQKCLLK